MEAVGDSVQAQPAGVVGLVIIVLFIVTILTTLAVDQITNYSFYNEYILKQDLSLRLAKPSLAHPLDATSLAGIFFCAFCGEPSFHLPSAWWAIALSVIMGAPSA